MGKKQKCIAKKSDNSRGVTIAYFVLRLLVVLNMITQVLRGNYYNVLLCILTLILFLLPEFIERKVKIKLPGTLEIIVVGFIFASQILGEINAYYIIIPMWDTMLHTLNGFLCAAIGFALVDILNREERFSINLSPMFLAVVAFCFSMTIGVLWEFFEFGMDQAFLMDMQKDDIYNSFSSMMLAPEGSSTAQVFNGITDVIIVQGDTQTSLGVGGYLDPGLQDTMKDMFVNLIGAVVFSIIGFFYVKSRGKGRFAKRFIPTVTSEDAEN